MVDHQTGSHVILRHQAPPHRRLSVPDHKELTKGTLRALLRLAGLTVEEFVALLQDGVNIDYSGALQKAQIDNAEYQPACG